MNQSQGYEPMFTWAQLQAAVAAEREKAAKVLLDDSYAMTFQSLGQYRTACAAAIRSMK